MASRPERKSRASFSLPAGLEPAGSKNLEMLHSFALRLLSAENPEAVFSLLTEQIDALIRPEAAVLLLVDPSGRILREEASFAGGGFASWRGGRVLTVQLDSVIEASGPAGRAFRDAKTVILPGISQDWRALAWPEAVGVRSGSSLAALPIMFNGEALGVIVTGFAPGREITPLTIGLLEQITAIAAPAIHNALRNRYLVETSAAVAESDIRKQKETSALVEIACSAGSTLDLSEVLSQVVRKTAELMGADLCMLWLLSDEGLLLLPSAMYGQDEEFVARWKGQAVPLEREPLSKEVVNTGKPVIVTDAETDHRTDKQAVRSFGDRSILVVPLLAKGRILGTLFLNHTQSRHIYSEQDIEIASALASQAAVAIDNARLYEETRRWTQHLEALQTVVATLNTCNSVAGIAATIADQTKNIINYDAARVFLLREGTDELVAVAYNGTADVVDHDGSDRTSAKIGEGIIGLVAQTGNPQLVGDAERDHRTLLALDNEGSDESMIVSPLVFQGRVTGVVALSKQGLRKFSRSDLRLLNILSNQAAIAIENARLYQETLQKNQQVRSSFRRIGEALSASPNLAETTQLILDLVMGIVTADACLLRVIGEDQQTVYAAGKGNGWEDASEVLEADTGLCARAVLRNGVHVHIFDMLSDSRASSLPGAFTENWPVYLGIPLLLAGKPTGTLIVLRRRAQPFSPTDIELLSSFANHAAIAVDRSLLFSALQERVDQFTCLHELSKIVSSVTSWEETLSRLVNQMARLVNADDCVIYLKSEEEEALVAQMPTIGLPEDGGQPTRISVLADDPAVAVWRTGDTIILNNTVTTPIGITRQGLVSMEQSTLVVPMRMGDRPIGVIRASNHSGRSFTDNDAKLLSILAAQAAAIVENAALYRKVRLEKEQLDAIFMSTSDAILIFDENGQVLRVNAAAAQLTEWTEEEAIGKRCRDLYRPHDDSGSCLCDAARCPFEHIKRTKRPVPYLETIATTKNGKKLDLAMSYSYFVSNGSLYGVAIARDISRVKEVDHFKSEFVSMMSHEFRSPLALIKGYASTMLRPDLVLDPERSHRFLSGINEAVDRLARLVDNALSTSRIEAGKLKPILRPVDLGELITRTATAFQETATKHQIIVNLPSGDVQLSADKDQIEQVLVNLLGNALKYSPKGGTVEVGLVEKSPNGANDDKQAQIEIYVKDEGIGIAAVHTDKVFEKWFRVNDSAGVSTPGSGLGLYVCRSIIEAHGGKIGLRSVKGIGTMVSFSLPSANRMSSRLDVSADKSLAISEEPS